jgi:Ca2+-binding EF-hand superfamily protein
MVTGKNGFSMFYLKYVLNDSVMLPRLISIKEFLGQYGEDQGPEWVQKEREHFAKTFDTNGNGKLEFEEIHKWVIPTRGESREETEHLMEGTDEDANGFLSVDEIILHFDLFVGSKATDHGETLKRMKHDEF